MEVLPIKRQNLMFSATLSPEVEEIIDSFFENTKKIEVAPSGTPLENIEQSGYFVPNFNTKLNLLKYLLVDDKTFKKVVVFVSTKKQADTVYEEIENQFHEQVGVIHSNKAQNNRFNTVNAFENGKIRILIATDLIARGIDITDVSHVINFDVPDQPENYINRIGRTGRAEKIGHSIAFVTLKEEEYLIACEVFMNKQVPLLQLPGDVEISDVLIAEEMPVIQMKNVLVKSPDRSERGAAFHEKSEKNKKVNKKIPHAKKMMMKYGKPKTRGQKPK
jgi:ATP-dependent RNA helicase RhlE